MLMLLCYSNFLGFTSLDKVAGKDASMETTNWRTSVINDAILHQRCKNLCVSLLCFCLALFSLYGWKIKNLNRPPVFCYIRCETSQMDWWCSADLEELILGLFLKVQVGLKENLQSAGNNWWRHLSCALSLFLLRTWGEKKPTIIMIWSSENQECHLFLPPAACYWPESLFGLHHCSTALVHFIYIKELIYLFFAFFCTWNAA